VDSTLPATLEEGVLTLTRNRPAVRNAIAPGLSQRDRREPELRGR
jgi:hypothetical protein